MTSSSYFLQSILISKTLWSPFSLSSTKGIQACSYKFLLISAWKMSTISNKLWKLCSSSTKTIVRKLRLSCRKEDWSLSSLRLSIRRDHKILPRNIMIPGEVWTARDLLSNQMAQIRASESKTWTRDLYQPEMRFIRDHSLLGLGPKEI